MTTDIVTFRAYLSERYIKYQNNEKLLKMIYDDTTHTTKTYEQWLECLLHRSELMRQGVIEFIYEDKANEDTSS